MAHLTGLHVQPVYTATQVVEAVTHVDDGVPVAKPGLWHILWLRQQRHWGHAERDLDLGQEKCYSYTEEKDTRTRASSLTTTTEPKRKPSKDCKAQDQ